MKVHYRSYARPNGDSAKLYFTDEFAKSHDNIERRPDVFGDRNGETFFDIDASHLRESILIDLERVGHCDVRA